ncbi:hypothetical protein B0H13DRAFT_2673600 [Mycena leptocephala]|nr:hypothetical protein B0H13DRAFT_2673600 [Mycena leptocephala]
MCKDPSDDPACKKTFILALLGLLVQWNQEISNADWKVLIYYGSNKPKKSDLLQYDVVLTIYSTVAFEWPGFEAEAERKEKAKCKKPDDLTRAPIVQDKKKKDRALLFQIDFYHIVLEKAQNIHNKRTSVFYSALAGWSL